MRREDDKVTRWLRANWLVNDRNYEFAMVMARLINRPESLAAIGYPYDGEYTMYHMERLERVAYERKPFWGNAYVVTTHGQPMDKVAYLIGVLERAHRVLPLAGVAPTCSAYWRALQGLEGFGSFMAAQVVADLKNTVFHPLASAPDFWAFVAMGPGSKRGLNRLMGRHINTAMSPLAFQGYMEDLFDEVQPQLYLQLHMQDFQNCLCEFDKYQRVLTGEGRSKRKYAGSV